MEFLFFNAAGEILFTRGDAESASVTHEQLQLQAAFPFDKNKEILRGMRVGYEDALGVFQVYEVRKVRTSEPDHFQEIGAEHIVISDLTDEFHEKRSWTNKTASEALTWVLTNTGWSVGTSSASNTSSYDMSRGDVWSAVKGIEKNWNVYILPRVTVTASGITGKYLDIVPACGTWRGFRLSLDKNANEIGVIWDDSNLKTALYGFGQETNGTPLTFANVVWTATSDHPAKPSGQTYLEDPAATAAYGRNGRPRFGYYQNASITNANTLIQKTWEVLKTVNVPDVSVNATITDLHRLGFVDVPIRLHDTALIEVRPTGVVLQKEIIQYTEDLLDPLQSRVSIGAYIPNIIYINRQTARRGGGGRGSGDSQDPLDYTIENNTVQIQVDSNGLNSLCVGTGAQLNPDGSLVVDEHGNPVFIDGGENLWSNIKQNKTSITAEVTNRQNADTELSGRITVEANKITQIVTAVGSNGEVTAASIVAAVNGSGSSVVISADHIDLQGYVTIDTLATDIASLQAVQVDVINGNSAEFTRMDTDLLYADEAHLAEIVMNGGTFSNCIISASVSGNVLTLTPLSGNPVTFSKATTLSGSWASGTYTVTAEQNSTTVATDFTALTNTGHWGVADDNEDVNVYYYETKATRNGQATVYSTGNTFTVNATARYNAGYDTAAGQVSLPGSGSSASFAVSYPKTTTSGGTTTRVQSTTSYSLEESGLTVSVTSGSGADKVIHASATCSDTNLDPGNIKDGVTIFGVTGTFSGSGTITAITKGTQTWKPADYTHGGFDVSVTASGTNVSAYTSTISVDAAYAYSAGWSDGFDDGEAQFSLATVHLQGTSGTVYIEDSENGTSYYQRGTLQTNQGSTGPKLFHRGTGQLYVLDAGTYKPIGNASTDWYYVSSIGTQYYNAGTTQYYAVNTSSKIVIKTATRYTAGSTVTDTYYTKS